MYIIKISHKYSQISLVLHLYSGSGLKFTSKQRTTKEAIRTYRQLKLKSINKKG